MPAQPTSPAIKRGPTRKTRPPIWTTEDNPEGAIRWALFSEGKFYLRGYSPSREHADKVVKAVAAAVGPDNVVDEYIIDPAAPLAAPAPIYVEDVILFEAESAELRPEFTALLDLAPAFLDQSPTIKLTVVARTDASGPAAYNLARRRATAVVDYYLSIGGDPSQVEADPRGEEGVEETNDPQEAALQRRVEFVVTGLFEN